MGDQLIDLVTASAWAYAIVLGFVALDALIPLVPGEAVVITAAVLAADGELSVVLVGAAALVGSFIGDNTAYRVGAGVGDRPVRRLLRGDRGRRMLGWATRQLEVRGAAVIVTARFVPGGRTATNLTAGTLALPWRRFVTAAGIAALLWSVYVTGLGYVGGTTFRDEEWKAIALSLAVALLVASTGELVRRLRTA